MTCRTITLSKFLLASAVLRSGGIIAYVILTFLWEFRGGEPLPYIREKESTPFFLFSPYIMSQSEPRDDGVRADSSSSSSSSTTTRPTKSWMTRSIGALMQLPKSTPLAALQWTTPEGPIPKVIHLPSRDQGRSIEVYIWVPKPAENDDTMIRPEKLQKKSSTSTSSSPAIKSSFTSVQRPCLVDFHGGGFVMGGCQEQAPWCSAMARSGIISISVSYRLGPTWEFPAALYDAEDVLCAVLGTTNKGGKKDSSSSSSILTSRVLQEAIDQEVGGPNKVMIDKEKVALSGFSSGGNVALNMLLNLSSKELKTADPTISTDDNGNWPCPFPSLSSISPIIPALLFFPSLDARQAPYERSRPPGMAPAGGFSKFIGRTMKNAYLPIDKVGHLRASPGLAPISSIHPSTRALLILPEQDTLAEQSETWVKKLDQDGLVEEVDNHTGETIGIPLLQQQNNKGAVVRVHRIKGMSHGFTTFPDSFLDVETRRVKQLVMEQARRWIIVMFDGDPGGKEESRQRVDAIVEGLAPGQGVKQPTAKLAKAVE